MTGGHAATADADLDRGTIVDVRVGEVGEAVVMNPRALRHLVCARAVHDDHLSFGEFILKRVMIDFGIVATNQQVMASAGKLKGTAGVAAMVGPGGDFFSVDIVGELESLNDNVGCGRFQMESVCAIDFHATEGFGRNG